ncbi:hypothetical protein FHW18_004758 [Pigmentiphaga litoralis]|uniref:Uncharacterized protein n=1 Tax=Pigmentiphaga litoralis TaxID=516702 RepID=A0A7Y9IYH1_9BURK|nr:hypothetical protein [Pigmentiphaga litoralis]NYE85451.1 hypothetical protein [Pigmentiphaga litoralis]
MGTWATHGTQDADRTDRTERTERIQGPPDTQAHIVRHTIL